jgi:hypothetical protein
MRKLREQRSRPRVPLRAERTCRPDTGGRREPPRDPDPPAPSMRASKASVRSKMKRGVRAPPVSGALKRTTARSIATLPLGALRPRTARAPDRARAASDRASLGNGVRADEGSVRRPRVLGRALGVHAAFPFGAAIAAVREGARSRRAFTNSAKASTLSRSRRPSVSATSRTCLCSISALRPRRPLSASWEIGAAWGTSGAVAEARPSLGSAREPRARLP